MTQESVSPPSAHIGSAHRICGVESVRAHNGAARVSAVAVPVVEVAVRDLCSVLLVEVDELAPGMAERIRSEVPLYREAGGVGREELDDSCRDNLRYVLGNLAGLALVDENAPRTTGRARAETGVPYSSVLQAYRVGGRYIWELLVDRADAAARETLLRAAADIWAVTDELSAQVTDAYRTALADRARRDIQLRAALLGTLLDGDANGAEQLWESASVLHLPRHGEFVIASAQCASPGVEALSAIESRLRLRDATSTWRLDHEYQDGIVALRQRFGLDDLRTELRQATHGRVGLSRIFTRIDDAHRAWREARLACAAATPGSTEVVRYDERRLAILVATSPDAGARFADDVLGPVLALSDDERRTVLHTVRVWLACQGSTSAAATKLHLHRNTVGYRLRRLEGLTGLSVARPSDLAELHLALECARVLALG